MRRFIVSPIAAALIMYVVAAPTDANATEIGQADALCKKNTKCVTMERGDKGNIYCVRQSDNSCKVVVCPKTGNCFVYMTVPGGGKTGDVSTPAGAKQALESRPKGTTTAGIGQVFGSKELLKSTSGSPQTSKANLGAGTPPAGILRAGTTRGTVSPPAGAVSPTPQPR